MPISSMAPADKFEPVTLANADLPGGVCRGLLVGTAGTANIMERGGAIRTNVPLTVGYNWLVCKQLRTGGSATNIWALY